MFLGWVWFGAGVVFGMGLVFHRFPNLLDTRFALYAQCTQGVIMAEAIKKTDRVYTRVTAAEKQLLASAAAAANTNVSDFVLESALREATNTLLDQRVFFASPEAFAAFEAALEAPAKTTAGLNELMNRDAPWE
jgi:uncharacterized protein (DUF1778 family)